jgi:hypothetical protein
MMLVEIRLWDRSGSCKTTAVRHNDYNTSTNAIVSVTVTGKSILNKNMQRATRLISFNRWSSSRCPCASSILKRCVGNVAGRGQIAPKSHSILRTAVRNSTNMKIDETPEPSSKEVAIAVANACAKLDVLRELSQKPEVGRRSQSDVKVDRMHQLSQHDKTTIRNLQNWASPHLPRSSKLFMEMAMFQACTDGSLMLFVDDTSNPSVVCYMRNAVNRLEVNMFSPLEPRQVPIDAVLDSIEKVQRRLGLTRLMFCGVDTALYKEGILKHAHKWNVDATEECGQYINETLLKEGISEKSDELLLLAGEGYQLCDLR